MTSEGVCVVTGGAAGIGRGVAERLKTTGWRVCVIDTDDAELKAMSSAGFDTIRAEIGADDELELAQRITSTVGVPTALVNNVGVNDLRSFFEMDKQSLRATLLANVESPVILAQGIASAQVAAGVQGSIVFVSSLHSRQVSSWPAYSISKAAMNMAVREMAWALADKGVRVNGVEPGWIQTSEAVTSDELARRASWVPMGRGGAPDDVAQAVAWLVGPESSYVTGSMLRVDGGLDLHSWLTNDRVRDRPSRRRWRRWSARNAPM